MRQMDLHAFSRVKDSAAVLWWEGFSQTPFDVQLERLFSAWGRKREGDTDWGPGKVVEA